MLPKMSAEMKNAKSAFECDKINYEQFSKQLNHPNLLLRELPVSHPLLGRINGTVALNASHGQNPQTGHIN